MHCCGHDSSVAVVFATIIVTAALNGHDRITTSRKKPLQRVQERMCVFSDASIGVVTATAFLATGFAVITTVS